MSTELSANSNTSHYRTVSKIGAGGMGEVYLARTPGWVAKSLLKILPAEVASNQDRMRRSVQEAKAAAALNHPNIAHIYEIGSSPVVSSPTVNKGSAHRSMISLCSVTKSDFALERLLSSRGRALFFAVSHRLKHRTSSCRRSGSPAWKRSAKTSEEDL